ncbi:MAG: pyrroline-5-carboxylate reductase [Acidimicrobiales bacterium]|nr:pyrroline-5-carboxylate reductase [Acidimicrobiales bacterium]
MTKLQIVGGGKMGEALLGGLLASGWASANEITVVEPVQARRDQLVETFAGLNVSANVVASAGTIIAVKPQLVGDVCGELAKVGTSRVLSIAAGISTATIEAALSAAAAAAAAPGAQIPVIRAMPNTPSLVGMGAAAIAGGSWASDSDLEWAETILGAVGVVVRLGEDKLNAVTGLSGSGPAYVFLIAEALIDAGVLVGLTREVSSELAIQTLRGSAELLAAGTAPSEARAAVTSPGGTTAAGLRALESAAVRSAIIDAVVASCERAGELG